MNSDRLKDLSLLKENHNVYPTSPSASILETFTNQYPTRDYVIEFDCPEFTSLCPVTNQPDFGNITIQYIANEKCIESKSLKLYLFSYRNHNSFHEEVTNQILEDIVEKCQPRKCTVIGKFRPRGGISLNITATYEGK